MGGGRNSETINLASTRKLPKDCLGGAIFGCKNTTMQECLTKQLFGLPSQHFPFVANISPGLPLFLFNYSERKMHGIYEAASNGQMNIDPYAWTDNGNARTAFPAQVRINVRTQCLPLSENHFRKAIEGNYHYRNHFWFELDRQQAETLMSLFKPVPVSADIKLASLPVTRAKPVPGPASRWKAKNSQQHNYCPDSKETRQSAEINDIHNFHHRDSGSEDQEVDEPKLLDLFNEHPQLPSPPELICNDSSVTCISPDVQKEAVLPDESTLNKVEEKAITSLLNHTAKFAKIAKELTQKMTRLDIYQANSDKEIQQLRHVVNESGRIEELKSKFEESETQHGHSNRFLEYEKIIYLIGGFDGSSWLAAVDSISPSRGYLESLKPMSHPRSYTAAAAVEENIFVFGGGDGNSWYDTVECYNQRKKEWIDCPKLNRAKGSHAAATLKGKIYVIGGGDCYECLTDVEMFDPTLGRWIPTPTLSKKRFATAALELDGVIYTVGGYDGIDYLMSAERYDPREAYWTTIPSLNIRRGCHSLAVMNQKIYAIGGYDGTGMVSSTEIFDPRRSCWMPGEPMSTIRGYATAAVLDDTIYIFGGLRSVEYLYDTVECFKEGAGWSNCGFNTINKRCFSSAVTM